MAIVRVQAPTFVNGTGTVISKAFASAVTAGNLLVAFATTDGSATFTFTSPGATWTTVASFLETTSGQHIAIGYAANVPGGSTTVTATFGAAGNFNTLIVAEYSGVDTVSPLDTNTPGQRIGVSKTPTDVTMTATATDLVVSVLVLNSGVTVTAGAGFSIIADDTVNLFAAEDEVLTSSGFTTPTWNLSANSVTGIMSAAFLPASGGSTINGTATLAGAGALTTSVMQLASSLLVGTGALTNTAIESVNAALVGAGTLTASAGGNQAGTCSMSGAGSLSVAATVLSLLNISSAGALIANPRQRAGVISVGAGTMIPVPVRQLVPTSTVGAGVLTATSAGQKFGTATLTGAGALSINLQPCVIFRIFTGTTMYGLATTARPGSGTTTYALATTARPSTGVTSPPCG